MLKSPLLPELHSSFYFDSSNCNYFRTPGRSRAMAVGSPRDSPSRATPAASSSAEAHLAFEPTTPRTYSHSPASVSTAAGGGDVVVQPWMFALFPDTYADAPAYPTAAAVVDGHYMHGVGSLVYGQSPPAPGSPHGAHPADAFDARIHGGVEPHRPDQPFYQSYDATGALREFERFSRDPKRVRLSPFSEYDSSSSECDPRDWAAHSDYARSPQLAAASSPNSGAYSPDSAAAHQPRSNPTASSHGHLAAQFPGPVRTKIRKVRRKLEPQEREQVHQLRKIGACTKCWGLKMKCDDGSPCKRCEKTGAGALCVRVHFVDLDVFSKWLVDSYSRTMMHHSLRFTAAPPRTLVVSHSAALGVTMQLTAFEFAPSAAEELDYWYRDAHGWRSTRTAPFAMKRGISTDVMERYITNHTYYFVERAFRDNPIMAEIFATALAYARTEDNFLLRDTLQLWTATQMLIAGAALHPTSETLGIAPIASAPPSPQAGRTPLPRVLANQIDHLLERRVWQLEKQILCELQKRIFGRKREDWLKIFFSAAVFTNALERDSWRLYYWLVHSDSGAHVWRHPSPPKRLIEKNDALATSLAAHFAAISKGLTPFAPDWTREQTLALLGGQCADAEALLAAIERIGRGLRDPEHARFTSNVLAHYRQDDESSLDFLYSCKVMIV